MQKIGHFLCNLRKVVFKPIVRQIKFLDKYELPVCALCGRELEMCKCGEIWEALTVQLCLQFLLIAHDRKYSDDKNTAVGEGCFENKRWKPAPKLQTEEVNTLKYLLRLQFQQKILQIALDWLVGC